MDYLGKAQAQDLPASLNARGRVRNPLSLLLYYRRNLRRIAPIMLILVLAFLGIALPVIIIDAQREAPLKVLTLFKHVALVWPNGQQGYQALDAGQLRRLPGSAAAYPVTLDDTYWPTMIGEAQGGTYIFGLNRVDMLPVMQRMQGRLVAGRLPASYAPEVAMHTVIAKARELEIGDTLEAEDGRGSVNENFKIVGMLDGPAPLQIFNREYLLANSPVRNDDNWNRAWLIFAQESPEQNLGYPQLEESLRMLPSDRYMVRSYQSQIEIVEEVNSSMDAVLIVLTTVIVSVLTLAVGLLNYIYFTRRLGEFGILMAIGMTRATLIRRALLETMVMIGTTWLLGLLLTEGFCQLLNAALLESRGTLLTAFGLRVLIFSLPLAVLGALSCVLTIVHQINKLDPVGIIEQRD